MHWWTSKSTTICMSELPPQSSFALQTSKNIYEKNNNYKLKKKKNRFYLKACCSVQLHPLTALHSSVRLIWEFQHIQGVATPLVSPHWCFPSVVGDIAPTESCHEPKKRKKKSPDSVHCALCSPIRMHFTQPLRCMHARLPVATTHAGDIELYIQSCFVAVNQKEKRR